MSRDQPLAVPSAPSQEDFDRWEKEVTDQILNEAKTQIANKLGIPSVQFDDVLQRDLERVVLGSGIGLGGTEHDQEVARRLAKKISGYVNMHLLGSNLGEKKSLGQRFRNLFGRAKPEVISNKSMPNFDPRELKDALSAVAEPERLKQRLEQERQPQTKQGVHINNPSLSPDFDSVSYRGPRQEQDVVQGIVLKSNPKIEVPVEGKFVPNREASVKVVFTDDKGNPLPKEPAPLPPDFDSIQSKRGQQWYENPDVVNPKKVNVEFVEDEPTWADVARGAIDPKKEERRGEETQRREEEQKRRSEMEQVVKEGVQMAKAEERYKREQEKAAAAEAQEKRVAEFRKKEVQRKEADAKAMAERIAAGPSRTPGHEPDLSAIQAAQEEIERKQKEMAAKLEREKEAKKARAQEKKERQQQENVRQAEVRERKEIAAEADAIFKAAQKDLSAKRAAEEEKRREGVVSKLAEGVYKGLQQEIRATPAPRWKSLVSGEYHVERDEVADVISDRVATAMYKSELTTASIDKLKPKDVVGAVKETQGFSEVRGFLDETQQQKHREDTGIAFASRAEGIANEVSQKLIEQQRRERAATAQKGKPKGMVK